MKKKGPTGKTVPVKSTAQRVRIGFVEGGGLLRGWGAEECREANEVELKNGERISLVRGHWRVRFLRKHNPLYLVGMRRWGEETVCS